MEQNSFDESVRGWTPPPGLAGSGPRDVSLTVGGWVVFVIGVALIVGSGPAGLALWRQATSQAQRDRLIQEAGAETDARITRLWTTSGKSSTHRVAYAFEYQGSVYRTSVRVPRDIWRTLHEGGTLRVQFVPSDPTMNRPRDWAQKPLWIGVPAIVAGAMVALGGMMFWGIQRAKSLLSDGRAVAGVVTRHVRTKDGVILKYEFRGPDGMRKGSCGSPRRQIPPVGGTVTVVYNPENPRRNMAYPSKLVKLQRD